MTGPSNAIVDLPRGGIYVSTPAGGVQFGIPPETIKDSMALGLDVPTTFVLPRDLFDRRRGINLAEAEFPAYYNYFILKRKIRLVVEDMSVQARVSAVFQESLFGPKSPNQPDEFDPDYPPPRRPDFVREMAYFRQQKSGKRHEIDDLIEFVRFDDNPSIALENDVRIERTDDGESYVVCHGEEELARAPARLSLPERQRAKSLVPLTFDPPDFGITVLGASHGFDPNGKTTGFVLWIGKRGLLIDPPVDTTEHLRERGVSPKLLDGVILTHCHADHDAGVLSKLLEEGRVQLFTTPTILGSFLRKYSALSGIDESLLRRTFKFRPVTIGAPMSMNGADLFFFYTLHSIPALGFEAFYRGKSLAFSGDTLFDPERIETMCKEGVLDPQRRDALLAFPWHHTVVLHEAGVPPLHTPLTALTALPESVKERLYLVHIAKSDVPTNDGLRAADVGLDNTIRINVDRHTHADALELLDAFSAVELFRKLPLDRARDFLLLAERVEEPEGTRLIAMDEPGDAFYVIAHGICEVTKDNQRLRSYGPGDYFGETALVLNQSRNADVYASTDVVLYRLDRHAFFYLLRGTDVPARLARLGRARDERSWDVVENNAGFRHLSASQKNELQSYFEVQKTAVGELLWESGKVGEAAFFVDEGAIEIEGTDTPLTPFVFGAFLGEIDAIGKGEPCVTSARVTEAGRVFRIARPHLVRFLKNNPGILLTLLGTRFIE